MTDPRPGAAAPATAGLSPLATACLTILEGEREFPALSAESLSGVLWIVGQGPGNRWPTAGEIEAAMSELIAAGWAETVWRRGTAGYRAMLPRTEAETRV